MKKGTTRTSQAERDQIIELRNSGMSYPMIAKDMGRDHTTIIYWIKKAVSEGKAVAYKAPPGRRKKVVKAVPVKAKVKPVKVKAKSMQKASPKVYFADDKKDHYVGYVKNGAVRRCSHSEGAYLHGRCWICTSKKSIVSKAS